MSTDISLLLNRVRRGDRAAESELFTAAYAELRHMAQALFRRERQDHTLQPTILVHEAYLKLIGNPWPVPGRRYFFGAWGRAMRQVLADHGRRRNAQKRARLKTDGLYTAEHAVTMDEDTLSIGEVLTVLTRINSRWRSVFQARVLEGYTATEAARLLGIGESTARREFAHSKQWLRYYLDKDGSVTEAGLILSKYHIEKTLAESPTSIIYKARDLRLGRPVVLKIIPASEPMETRRRLYREAYCAASLNHPYIVTVHDMAFTPAADIMIMEYVPGRTLQRAIPKSGFAVEIALAYAEQIVMALSAAHVANIIHRDLKPSNVLLCAGSIKLLDFGLAKPMIPSPLAKDADSYIHTCPGTILGTVGYMAPEQVKGDRCDFRSDVFSFGAVFYEMLTGKRAFHRKSNIESLGAILKDTVTSFPKHVPQSLIRIVRRCLMKDPERRFQTATDLGAALARSRRPK